MIQDLPLWFWLTVAFLLCSLGWAIRPLIRNPKWHPGFIAPTYPHDSTAIQKVPLRVRNAIDAIDWSNLFQAYGRATDAPNSLTDLFSNDEVCYTNAIYDFLLSCAFHQYTLYSCTSSVIQVAAEILRCPETKSMPLKDPSLRAELVDFILSCAKCGQRSVLRPSIHRPTIEEAVLASRSLFEKLAEDSELGVSNAARQLLDWCSTQR